MKKKYCRKALGWSLGVVASISFIAPPLGDDSAGHALASAVGGLDDFFGGETGTTENTCEELNAGLINKEAGQNTLKAEQSNTAEAAGESEILENYRAQLQIDLSESKLVKVLTGELAKACERAEDELDLLELSWQDELTSDELVQVVKGPKTAEELFYENLDWSGIPEVLKVSFNESYRMQLSAEQRKVLETIVEAEAGDEDTFGKILVANVVLNRVLDEKFPDTVKEVVFQNNGRTYQFSPVRKGGRYYTVKVSEHTREAVARALSGEDYSDGALYFFARKYTSNEKANWFDSSLRKIVKYGCHEFYAEK